MKHLMLFPKFRAFDSNGEPLTGGLLYTYGAGGTTPLATYADISGDTPNTNPVVLDANGEANVWVGVEPYKFVLKDSSGVTQWTQDNVQQVGDGSVNTNQLADGALENSTAGRAKMDDGFLSATADGLAKMAAGFLQATTTGLSKMADGFLAASAAGRAKMADGFLSADSTGRAKMADGYLTNAKRAAANIVDSPSSGNLGTTTSSAAWVDVNNLSVTITSIGRPISLNIINDGSGNSSRLGADGTSGTGYAYFRILRGATEVWQSKIGVVDVGESKEVMAGALIFDPAPPSGSLTYKVQFVGDTGVTSNARFVKLVAVEH